MALHRVFSYGRFNCSSASPKVSVVDYQNEGYALVVRKDTTKQYCLRCMKKFVAAKGLMTMENDKYLTIHSP